MLERPVTHYMRTPVFSVSATDSLERARERLEQHGVSSLAVFDGATPLAGIISRTDLLNAGTILRADDAISLELPDGIVRDSMRHPVISVTTQTNVRDAAKVLVDEHVHRVFVANAGHPLGVFSTKDLLRAVVDARLSQPVSSLMSRDLLTVHGSEPLQVGLQRLGETSVHGLVVVDDNGWPIGAFTQLDALEARGADTTVERAMTARVAITSAKTALHHAAAQAAANRVKRVFVVENHQLVGVLTGLDFARGAASS